ncbi:NAD(P)-dependent dehydrogenase (short-subunit alcohol dehydrogenase family) [Streptomyces aurantiacus]|uniref:SDR family NAD(P)-dependent oxidoreductase n=1 Tax=Streptomyces aurantiacus TaxID=47760 RepID=UPI0027930165|nr:NAD(P)-dependent dehydrogenase (short-subunit alcohol dehydrogenase family) [Streptomyces aurantiacus]
MTSTSSLAGKRVLVTGGSGGIGAAIVRRLATQGATVAVNYRSDKAGADELVGELRDNGSTASAFPADISDMAQTHELVGAVVSEFGGLDLLVSNAGVEHFGALETITQADFDHLFRTNVAGQLFVTQAAVAAMTDGGRIVLSSSVSVRLAVHHHALYAASKAAIPAMVRNLAPELAERNIAINAISPRRHQHPHDPLRPPLHPPRTHRRTVPRTPPLDERTRPVGPTRRNRRRGRVSALLGRVLHHRHHHRSRRRLELASWRISELAN